MNWGIRQPNFWPISIDKLPLLSRFHKFILLLASQPTLRKLMISLNSFTPLYILLKLSLICQPWIVFFDSLELVRVDADTAERLESPITMDDLQRATFSTQSGKCPGPDGFPIEFYKTFFDKLSPVLIEMFNECLTLSKLPDSKSGLYIITLKKE